MNKPAIFKLIEPYAQKFVPKLYLDAFPCPISDFYNCDALALEYVDLLKECETVFATIQIRNISNACMVKNNFKIILLDNN